LANCGRTTLEALEVARQVVTAASEKKATDIVLLDTREVCSFADYFVMCCGESPKQIEAIRSEIGHSLKKKGILPHHYEGTVDSGWLLIDLGGVIVHIFAPVEREHYQLDQLWGQATPIVRIQ
jgi:ribosome-associated protein